MSYFPAKRRPYDPKVTFAATGQKEYLLMKNGLAIERLFDGEEFSIPPLPDVAMKVVTILQNDDFSIKELTETISLDSHLSAQTLKIVNSALFTTDREITDLEDAVALFAASNLRYIILSFVIFEELKKFDPDFDYDNFWNLSITNAVIARTLATLLEIDRPGIFLTALLKDIGTVLLFQAKKEEYSRVLAQHPVHEIEMADTEQEILGVDHAELGMELLKSWGFPESVYMAVSYHATTEAVPGKYQKTVNLLQLSTLVSSLFNDSKSITPTDLIKIRNTFNDKLNLKDSEFIRLLDEIAKESIAVLVAYEVPVGDIKPYSQILQDSHEELCNLNYAYESLLLELQQSRDTAKDLSEKLSAANEELTGMAYKDSLTGLYNHRFFHEAFDKEISVSRRYSRVFSLLMLDLDGFKPINDTLGHKSGDEVLKIVSSIILESIREGDTASRIGGDEFAILFPETDKESGIILAERLRLAVEKASRKFKEDNELGFSISVGVGAFMPSDESETKENLLHQVDTALYSSKEGGKNRVTAL